MQFVIAVLLPLTLTQVLFQDTVSPSNDQIVGMPHAVCFSCVLQQDTNGKLLVHVLILTVRQTTAHS